MIAAIVIILTALGLWAGWWLIRAVARDLYSMDEDEDVRKEIERWRDGK